MMTDKKIFVFDGGGKDDACVREWFVCYYRNGKRIRVKGGINREKTPEARRRVAAAIINQLLRNNLVDDVDYRHIPEGTAAELRASIAGLIADWHARLRPKSVQTYLGKVDRFLDWVDANVKGVFTTEHAELFMRHVSTSGANATTWNNYRSVCRTVFSELWPSRPNPFDKLRARRKQEPTPAMFFQSAQIRQLKAAISNKDPQLWLFCQFIYYAFIRPGELRQLRIGDLLIDSQQILVPADIAKNKKRQFVHIPDGLDESIKAAGLEDCPTNYFVFGRHGVPGHEPISINSMKLRHQRILKAMNWDTRKFKLYSWKHTGAVACIRAGVNPKTLQLQLRHSSLNETDIYLRSLGIQHTGEIKGLHPKI